MLLEKADSNTDMEGFLPDRMFFQPKVIAAPSNERQTIVVDARHSSSETERLVLEEIEHMEKEKEQEENQLREEIKVMESEREKEKELQEKSAMKQHYDEMKPGQDKPTSSLEDNTDVVRTVKDIHRINKENEKNISLKKKLCYGNVVRSPFDPPRTGTPVISKRDPKTSAQREQLLTRYDEVNNKPPEQHLTQAGSFTSNSLAGSSSGHGSLPSSSILLPTVSSCGIVSSMSSALDTIDIGQQRATDNGSLLL